jgi:hypothetical protein
MIHTFGEVIYAKRTVNLVAPVMPLIVEYFTRIKATVEEMSNAKKKKTHQSYGYLSLSRINSLILALKV